MARLALPDCVALQAQRVQLEPLVRPALGERPEPLVAQATTVIRACPFREGQARLEPLVQRVPQARLEPLVQPGALDLQGEPARTAILVCRSQAEQD